MFSNIVPLSSELIQKHLTYHYIGLSGAIQMNDLMAYYLRHSPIKELGKYRLWTMHYVVSLCDITFGFSMCSMRSSLYEYTRLTSDVKTLPIILRYPPKFHLVFNLVDVLED